MRRAWTKEEVQELEEMWGTVSVRTLAKNLGRSETAIAVKKQRLNLGGLRI